VPTWTGVCDEGEGFVSFGGSCYFTTGEVMNWLDARATCQAARGYLAAVGSSEENDLLIGLVDRPWVGGCHDGDGWVWINGEPWGWSRWDTNQPSGDGDCVEVYPEGVWNDFYCDSTTYGESFVCEFD